MSEFQSANQGRALAGDAASVSHFVSQVVSLLVDRTIKSTSTLREELVCGLISAAQAGTEAAFTQLLVEIKKSRISFAMLADVYIPLAARRMGDAWQSDEMTWMQVSIGVGRLQSLLREVGAAWFADQAADTGHGTVLLIVPDREQHTLGPMVATGQMRRYGVSVCLRIAPSGAELRALMAVRRFNGVMISLATRDKVDSVAKLVQFLREVSAHPVPVIVGGAVMETVQDLASCTGADFASNDIGAALESMGLQFDALCVLKRA
jgi:MerR family transcriptional regulator, light-induced transcriptional regulator